jgi:hypothetical protein
MFGMCVIINDCLAQQQTSIYLYNYIYINKVIIYL